MTMLSLQRTAAEPGPAANSRIPGYGGQLLLYAFIAAVVTAFTALTGLLTVSHAFIAGFAAWLVVSWVVSSILPRDLKPPADRP